jgi:transposase
MICGCALCGRWTRARRYGRSLRGQWLVMSVPYGHWKTNTFIAGLRHDRIDAPCVIDGPITGELFHAYVEQFLAPSLARGAELLYLPPYGPGMNPFEQMFAKLRRRFAKPPSVPSTSSGYRRTAARRLQSKRMRQLPQKLWTCATWAGNTLGLQFHIQ